MLRGFGDGTAFYCDRSGAEATAAAMFGFDLESADCPDVFAPLTAAANARDAAAQENRLLLAAQMHDAISGRLEVVKQWMLEDENGRQLLYQVLCAADCSDLERCVTVHSYRDDDTSP